MQAPLLLQHRCLSVRRSACHTLVLYQNNFFINGQPKDCSFCRYLVHPEILKGSTGTRALNGVRLVQIGDFQPLSHHISEMVQRLLLIINRKLYTCFCLVSKSTTLNRHYAPSYTTYMYFGAHYKNLKEYRTILSAAKM